LRQGTPGHDFTIVPGDPTPRHRSANSKACTNAAADKQIRLANLSSSKNCSSRRQSSNSRYLQVCWFADRRQLTKYRPSKDSSPTWNRDLQLNVANMESAMPALENSAFAVFLKRASGKLALQRISSDAVNLHCSARFQCPFIPSAQFNRFRIAHSHPFGKAEGSDLVSSVKAKTFHGCQYLWTSGQNFGRAQAFCNGDALRSGLEIRAPSFP